MIDKRPTTSLKEDLKFLGLDVAKPLAEDEAADKDAKDAAEEEKEGDEKDAKRAAKEDEKDEKAEKEAPMAYSEQLEAAWDVVRDYYSLTEDAKLTEDHFRTVIDAMGFIIESLAEAQQSAKPGTEGLSKEPDELPGGGDNAAVDHKPAGGPLSPEKSVTKYPRVQSGKVVANRQDQKLAGKAESVDNLVNDLKNLAQSVAESEPTAEQLDVSTKLIEGFESVRDTATEVSNRVKTDLSEDNKASEDDPRNEVAAYFEGIASDAELVLEAIANGDVEIDDACEDLASISDDLKKGLNSLKDVG